MPAANISTTFPDASLPSNCVGASTLMRRHSAGCIHVSTDGDLTKLGDGDPVPALQLLVARLDGEMLPAEGCTL